MEANDWGVRVAKLRLQRPGIGLQFVLYPMLHIGSREFYREVTQRLMVQRIDFGSLPGQVICPDSSGEEFASRWRTVPWWQRAGVLGVIGSATAAQRLFGSRWLQLALQHASLDDLPDTEELLQPDLTPDVERVVLDERDERLVAALRDLHEQRAADPITVAVVYGVQHMRAVVTGLRALGYRARGGDWLTVMTFD